MVGGLHTQIQIEIQIGLRNTRLLFFTFSSNFVKGAFQNQKSRPGRISRGTLMFTTMTSFFIILCLCSLLLVKLQVPFLVVFLSTELLAAMPNQTIANNAEVEVWFVQPELNSLEPNFFLIPTENGLKTDRKGQVLSRIPKERLKVSVNNGQL